ncbi:MAG: hypothetical protein ACRD1B_08710, partial [Thermoanaerobaculia bacterium]
MAARRLRETGRRAAGGCVLLLAAAGMAAAGRRIAIRAPEALLQSGEIDRIKGWAPSNGVALEVGADDAPTPSGAEVVRLALTPVSEVFARAASRFPVKLEPDGFEFDGRWYRGAQDAVALADPGKPQETLVVGNGRQALVRLAARRLFWRETPPPDYQVVSGALTKQGRFVGARAAFLAIDRASDRDDIGAREAFFKARGAVEKDGVRWLCRQEERAAADRWAAVLKRFPSRGRKAGSLSVGLFPDAATKAKYAGSSRPADLVEDGAGFRVDIDASAPGEPDLVSPVLAAAALAAQAPALARRPLLLLAAGARAAGRWWGRDVVSFGAFAKGADVEPTVADVVASAPDLSPVLAVGALAAWLEAGVRLDGEAAVIKILAGFEPELSAALERWRAIAVRQAVAPPPRRELPKGFLRGVSYAMTNSIDGGYASSRSRETLGKLAGLAVNSIAIMPFGFGGDPHAPEIRFIHREP